MKVFEVVQPSSEWNKVNHDLEPHTDPARALAQRQLHLIYKRNNLLFERLQELTERYPNDIFVAAFPAENDEDFAHPKGPPLQVERHINEFEVIEPRNLLWYDGEMQYQEWDSTHPHEKWYIRKSKPQLVTAVKQLLAQYDANAKLLGSLKRASKRKWED